MISIEQVLEAAPEDREHSPEAVKLQDALEHAIWPVSMFGRLADKQAVLDIAVKAGYNPDTGSHKDSIESRGAVVVVIKGTRCALYWD